MTNQKSLIVRSCFFHLRCLGKLRQYLNRTTANTIAVLLVLLRQDYWNNCLWGMPKNQLLRLQRVQNTAARIVTHLNKRSQSTSLPFSVSYTGYLLKRVLTTKSCFLCTAARMAQPLSAFGNSYPATFQCVICGRSPSLVFAPPVSTKETTKKLWNQSSLVS